MDRRLSHLLAAPTDGQPALATRRAFSIEFDRRGLFVSLGRFDGYLCAEPESAWSFLREPGSFDAQVWRLHLIVSRVPL
jgi:hypothetical protein